MNGSLPGLLDDPQFQIANLPSLPDSHIAPLRNPAPLRHANAPLPLEPVTENALGDRLRYVSDQAQSDENVNRKSSTPLTLHEPPSAREVKKPQIAISELLDGTVDEENVALQLPSFVSLSVVEKSPTQATSHLHNTYPRKRARLDLEADHGVYDVNRLLPRPAQKDDQQTRPVPLLPAMVTGLHEPPPSAALLPSMDPDARLGPKRNANSKMQVKDILREPQQISNSRPPELMLNTPELSAAELPKGDDTAANDLTNDTNSATSAMDALTIPRKHLKLRRARRKWSEKETLDLLAGVKKHGFGKWKQILTDQEYSFMERTSIDLKDRFRVFSKDFSDTALSSAQDLASSGELPIEANESAGPVVNNVESALASVAASGAVLSARPRRKRHPWTQEEDNALLQGVNKHGFQWTDIHNDEELNLSHRRATDLRDRIRNLYPEGYKRAEARPLRRELKKVEKINDRDQTGQNSGSAASTTRMNSLSQAETTPKDELVHDSTNRKSDTSKDTSAKSLAGKAPSIASLTTNKHGVTTRLAQKSTKITIDNQPAEASGVTLPSLDLDDGGDTDWGDNRLAPFLGWDDNLTM